MNKNNISTTNGKKLEEFKLKSSFKNYREKK